jgi:hypothetical protein
LRRVAPGAVYKEELGQLIVPVPAGELAADVVRRLLEDLMPIADSAAAGTPGSMRGA